MIEIGAVIFSLLSVYYTVKNKLVAWPIGIVGIIFYTLYFFNMDIVGNMYLQFLFLLQSLYGWYNWKNIDKKITNLDKIDNINIIISTCISTYIIYFILSIIDSSFNIFDSITTGISLTAMLLLARHKIESWCYWILVDILYTLFFIYIGSYLSAITYFTFLILAIIGLKQWNIEIKKH